jgi:HSP20 family protein
MSITKRKPSFLDNDAWDLPARMLNNDEIIRGKDLPAVNIKDHGDSFSVHVVAPGYRKEELKAQVENGVLTISSERRDEHEDAKGNYTRREFHYSSFARSFQLPATADEDAVKATYADGILELVIGKKKAPNLDRNREIPIG